MEEKNHAAEKTLVKPPEAQKPHPVMAIIRHEMFPLVAFAILLIIGATAYSYWQDSQTKIYIESATITAPLISIAPLAPGIIEKVYVREGDTVSESQRLARVGGQDLTAKTSGIVVFALNAPGEVSSAASPVVEMIDPRELRLVGSIAEDKGLGDIHPGQKVAFTVDAFGSRQFEGVVESVASMATQSDIVFSISDQRQERDFEVTVDFNSFEYPEFKNGMSARMWVFR